MATQLIIDNGSISGLSGMRYAPDSSGILQILTGAGVVALTLDAAQNLTAANTPAQFDNTAKLATTAFVQRALGNWVGQTGYSANATIGAAQAGYTIQVIANATISINPAGLAVGSRFYIVGNGGNVTINRSDAGNIVAYGVNTITSFSFSSGSGVSLYWDGGSIVIENYDQNIKYSQGFANNQSANGYAKIASGVIIQWGTVTLAANTRTTITYPIAFPSSGASVTSGSDWSSAGATGWAPCGACPNNTTSATIWNTDDVSRQVWYMAVGY
jgi:hypothetical protein